MARHPLPPADHVRRLAFGERVLAIVLLWNALAGVVMRLPVLAGDEPRSDGVSLGLVTSWPPTMMAGLWMLLLGVLGVHWARRRNPAWHWVASVFYLFQVVAVLAPIRIVFWTGIFVAVPVGIGPAFAAAVNVLGLFLLVIHLRLALRLSRGTLGTVGAMARHIGTRVWLAAAASARGLARFWSSTGERTTANSPVEVAFEMVVGPVRVLCLLDAAIQFMAVVRWNPLEGGYALVLFWYLFLFAAWVVGLPLAWIAARSKRPLDIGLSLLLLCLTVANGVLFGVRN